MLMAVECGSLSKASRKLGQPLATVSRKISELESHLKADLLIRSSKGLELTPAGPIISMVDFDSPDLERYPNFPSAMEAALTVDLEPGDVLYIPYLWWHHVRSIERVNMLVNYWWTPPAPPDCHPLPAMLNVMLALKYLPEPHRAAWRSLFDHFVFEDHGAPGTHLPADRRGVQGAISEDAARGLLRSGLMRASPR